MGRQRTVARKSGAGLVSAYILHTGAEEERRANPNPEGAGSKFSPYRASRMVGYGCMLLTAGNDRQADRVIQSVRDRMAPTSEDAGRRAVIARSDVPYLFHLATMLLDRDSPDAADQYRSAARKTAARDANRLGSNLAQSNGKRRGEIVGLRTEILMLGLLNGGHDPDAIALRALIHHNVSDERHRGNHDLVTVSYDDAGDLQTIVYKQQLKDGCQDYCNGNEGNPRGLITRADYEDDITIISGHCDIHGGSPGRLSRALASERSGTASPATREMLDAQRQELLTTIRHPEAWRIGALQTAG